ncbi:MAG TPA: hypothetical protein VGI39_04400 [Polyangiaceae bacterium]|jgi:hypothetical protein
MKTVTVAVVVRCAGLASLALAGCSRSGDAAPTASAASATPPPAPTVPATTTSATISTDAAAAANAPRLYTFDAETVGAPSPEFDGVVGDWYAADDGGQRGLRVDGSKWSQGTPSANLADQAKRLYGDRYAEFLDGVKAFAFFPLAVLRDPPPGGDVRISMRFYPEAGRIDQGAGIAFGIAPDGSYQGVRANALEGNILYFKVVKGHRTVYENVRNTPTATRQWHTLAVELRGAHEAVFLDGTKRLDRELIEPAHGRVGIWSKADSQVLFDDYKIEPL